MSRSFISSVGYSRRAGFLLVVLGLLCSIVLAACGDATPTSAPSTTVASTPSAAATTAAVSSKLPVPTGPITLKIIQWSNPAAVDALKKINDRFAQTYPNIKVEMTEVPTNTYPQLQDTRLAANDVDILANQAFVGSVKDWAPGAAKPKWQQWIDAGLIEDLSGKPFLANYDQQALKDAGGYNGKLYSVTTGRYATTGLYYNKTIFEKNNLKVPTTFQELVKVCETLQAANIACFTAGGKEGWPVDVFTTGIRVALFPDAEAVVKGLWTGDVKYTDPTWVQSLERGQKLLSFAEKGFMGLDNAGAVSRFANEKSAMLPNGTWEAATISKANPALKFGYIPMPASDDPNANKQLYGKYDLAWLVASQSKNKAAAMLWLDFFSQPENYELYMNSVGILPSQPNAKLESTFAKEVAPYLTNFKLDYSQYWVTRPNGGKYINVPLRYLVPAGELTSAAELAKLGQADWDAAKPK